MVQDVLLTGLKKNTSGCSPPFYLLSVSFSSMYVAKNTLFNVLSMSVN